MRDDDVDDTVIRPRRHPSVEADVGDTVIRPRRDRSVEADVGDTVIRPRRDPSGGSDVGDTVIRPHPGPLADPAVGDTVIRPLRSGTATRSGSGSVAATPVVPAVPPMPTVPERRVAAIRFREQVIPLDRPVVVGRRPAGPRIPRGPEPLMLAVPSATGQVSGTHVTIRSEGAAVVVEDARSTNGTFVRVPGAPPIRMRAGAAMVVLTGTVVDIGDGNVIEILSPHLRPRPDSVGPGTLDPDTGFPAAHPGMGFPDAERPTP